MGTELGKVGKPKIVSELSLICPFFISPKVFAII